MTFAIFVTSLFAFFLTGTTAVLGNRLNYAGTFLLFASIFGLSYSAAVLFGFS
jgi:hypothetical protein